MLRCLRKFAPASQIIFIPVLFLAACRFTTKQSSPAISGRQEAEARSFYQLDLLSTFPLSRARSVALLGETAYVARGLDGASLLNIANPHRPTLIAHWPTTVTQPLHFAISPASKVLFAADRFRGLLAFDLAASDPTTTIAELPLPGIATHLELFDRGSRRYAAVSCGGEGFAIVDVTDPRAPTRVSLFSLGTDYVTQVCVRGHAAFVANNDDGGLELFDMAKLDKPRPVYRASMPGYCVAVDCAPPLAIVALRHAGFAVLRTNAHEQFASNLTSENPSLELLCRVSRIPAYYRGIRFLNNQLVALANSDAGVELYDVSRAEIPVLEDSIAVPGDPVSIEFRGDLLYVAAWDGGLCIVRVSKVQDSERGRH